MIKKDPDEEAIARIEKIIASQRREDTSDIENRMQGNRDLLVGYVLPAQADQKKHVVILRNGSILIIRPPLPGKALFGEEYYEKKFSPNSHPIEVGRSYGGVDALETTYIPLFGEIVLSSKNPRDLPKISEAVSQSLGLARELKASRDKAKQEGLGNLMGQLDTFFGKDKPKDTPPGQNFPPAAPPPSGPPNSGSTF